jgi:hypothetical protein
MSAPPEDDILPPPVAEFMVIFVIEVVVNVGSTGSFLQLLIIKNPEIRQTNTRKPTLLFIITLINYCRI